MRNENEFTQEFSCNPNSSQTSYETTAAFIHKAPIIGYIIEINRK